MKRLAGTWYSERGSRLDLIIIRDGLLEGHYTRPPGKSQGSFRLVGMVDPADFEGNRCLAFSVLWNNEFVNQHSVSVWSGQYRDAGGHETLDMVWLLSEETAPGDDWTSTRVGSDVFHREPQK
ncbi:MAG: hypothetical protein JNJ61_07975 [Anaerolineae bacterium]|nr:hypothetical protein [Anaerolineae bacterium]